MAPYYEQDGTQEDRMWKRLCGAVACLACLSVGIAGAQGGVRWDREPPTTHQHGRELQHPQAFMNAMNGQGDYYHRWTWGGRESVVHRVSNVVHPALAFTWSHDDGCLYWDDEGVVVQIRLAELYCQNILATLAGIWGPDLQAKQLYPVRGRRIGIEHYVTASGRFWCRFTIRPKGGGMSSPQQPTTSECLALFDGLIGRPWPGPLVRR